MHRAFDTLLGMTTHPYVIGVWAIIMGLFLLSNSQAFVLLWTVPFGVVFGLLLLDNKLPHPKHR